MNRGRFTHIYGFNSLVWATDLLGHASEQYINSELIKWVVILVENHEVRLWAIIAYLFLFCIKWYNKGRTDQTIEFVDRADNKWSFVSYTHTYSVAHTYLLWTLSSGNHSIGNIKHVWNEHTHRIFLFHEQSLDDSPNAFCVARVFHRPLDGRSFTENE